LPEQNLKIQFDYTYAEQALSGLEKTNAVCGKTKKRELEEQIKNLNGSLQKIKVEAKNYVITARYLGLLRISQNSGRFFFECFAAHCHYFGYRQTNCGK
jgi:hypothetical protein